MSDAAITTLITAVLRPGVTASDVRDHAVATARAQLGAPGAEVTWVEPADVAETDADRPHDQLVVPVTTPAGSTLGGLAVAPAPVPTDPVRSTLELIAIVAAAALTRIDVVQQARLARSQLRALDDALPGGILVRGTDGRVTYTNNWIADYRGVTPEEIVGTEPGEVYTLLDESRRPLPPERYPSMRAGRGETFDSVVVGMERADGDLRWLATSGRPLVDDDGARLGGLIVFVDVTEPVRARRRLARSEQLLREAELVGRMGSWLRDVRTGEVEVSGGLRRLFGIPPDEPVDRETLYALFHPDDRPTVFQGTFRTFDEGTPLNLRVRAVDRSGRERQVEIGVERFVDDAGEPAGLVGTVRDLTAELAQEERLAAAERMEMVGRLAGGLAHDFNNLLTVLTGHVQLLRDDATDAQQPSLDAIEAAARRAGLLTRQLLEFGRREVLQPRAVDVDELADHLFTMTRSIVPASITMSLERSPRGPGSPPPVAFVDPAKLEQVLLNLVFNARDALVDRGRIVVRDAVVDVTDDPVLEPGRYVSVEVVDDGPGMTPEILERAVEPFFTTKPAGHGTGLGLATSYGIVAQSGGHLSLSSRPGQGTTARVLVPWSADEPRRADTRQAAPGRADGRRHATVLIAEDEDDLRPLLARVVRERGHEVLTAADGHEALEVAARSGRHVDLLITDVSMPRRGGHELAEALTAVHPDLRVIYMSGYTEDSGIVRGIAERHLEFLAKPFTMEQLTERIDRVLASAARRSGS